MTKIRFKVFKINPKNFKNKKKEIKGKSCIFIFLKSKIIKI